MTGSRIFGRIAIGLLLALPLASRASADEVFIAVAANFTDATRDIVAAFEKETGHTVKPSFASTGKLYAQITHGAPFQVFLAADSARPEKAEAEGYAVPGSRFTYALGQLVLWSSTPGRFDDGADFLRSGSFNHVAIANPKTAPYGLAAEQVMETLGVWKTLQPKLVTGDSIAQTFQFVATANADVGFVALSQLKAWSRPGSSWTVPQADYAPITQQAVLLKKGADSEAAKAFLAYLGGERATRIILDYGYAIDRTDLQAARPRPAE
jgi:molybdate transport system substrate-binding protein